MLIGQDGSAIRTEQFSSTNGTSGTIEFTEKSTPKRLHHDSKALRNKDKATTISTKVIVEESKLQLEKAHSEVQGERQIQKTITEPHGNTQR